MKKNVTSNHLVFASTLTRAVFLAGIVVTAAMTPALAQRDGENNDHKRVKVFPPQSHPYGKSYGQWSAEWWKWALSLPVDQNPFYDVSGCQNGANGQSGPVWFLTGVIAESGVAVRDCTVPGGKALFFPVINTECSTLEPPPFHGNNEAELRACAANFNVVNLAAEVDGVAVKNLDDYRVFSPLFTFTVPDNNPLGVPAGTGQAVGNGFYLMLAPLSPGHHTIHFGGTYPDFNFTLSITYHLTVLPGHHHDGDSDDGSDD